MALMICLILSMGRIETNSNTLKDVIAAEIKKTVYTSVVKSYMPGLYFGVSGEKKEQTAAEFLTEKVLEVLPLYGYIETQSNYETPSESELSYEAILQREAIDENYVDDETGEVILAAIAENQNEVLSSLETENAEQREDDTETSPTEDDKNSQSPAEDTQDVLAVTGDMIGNFQVQNTPLVTYSREKLNDFDYLIQKFYTVDRSTTITSKKLSAKKLLAKDLHLTTTSDEPQILIYHTHSQEMYKDSTSGDVMTGVVGCGEYLAEILREKYGLNVIHHTGQYDAETRDHAYSKAAPALEKLLEENPSIEVVIDLHRDAVKEGTHLVQEVQGVKMAPLMFFNGLSYLSGKGEINYLKNPYIQDNLAFSLQMKLAAMEYYPDLTRPIYLKGYRYNMHYCPKTLLVEVGAQTNTFEEAKNAMAPLADLLNKVLCE